MIDKENLKLVSELLTKAQNNDENAQNELNNIQKKCNHQIGIKLKSQYVSDYDLSVYKCLNCSKNFIGEQIKGNDYFNIIIDISYLNDSYENIYEKINRSFYLQRRFDEESSDEDLSNQINKTFKKLYNIKQNNK